MILGPIGPAPRRRLFALVLVATGCVAHAGDGAAPLIPVAEAAYSGARFGGHPVRVSLAEGVAAAEPCADGAWQLVDGDGRVLAAGQRCEPVRLAAAGGRVRVVPTGATAARVVLRADAPDGAVRWRGTRYRGDLEIAVDGGALRVVNRVGLEDYLRGVVPAEIGGRDPRDRAAVEAQAVAARTYAAARIGARAARPFDLVAGTADQVYGGLDAERPETDDAVRGTRGLVLTWGDAIAATPYSANAGAVTAAPDEVFWRQSPSPYLRPVDDRAPDGRCWCDVSGRTGWERRFTAADLAALLVRHGAAYGARPPGGVGAIRAVRIAERGPSGRVTRLDVETDGGRATLRGNDIRYVLRLRGELLPSTAFDLSVEGGDGAVAAITLRGHGNGHGVGMSQWGAIGRARAGQDARTILAAYYPGTRLAPLQ
jgi:stage II sporulation protein D